MRGFSAGEKDLYRTVKQIQTKKAAEKRAELARTKAYFQERSYEGQPLPVPSKKAENRARFGRNTENELTEWEKNSIRPMFRKMVVAGKKGVSKDNLVSIMQRLANDECVIGKIPDMEEAEYEGLFADWDLNSDGLVSWSEFCEGCNKWQWHFVDDETLQKTIDEFFAKAHKLKMQGKEAESHEMASKALRLQGSQTRAKPQ